MAGVFGARLVVYLAIVAVCMAWGNPSRAEILLAYNEKPPFFFSDQGQPSGLLVDVVRKVFEKAALPHRFESRPFNRIMRDLQLASPDYCAVGFSKTPDREKFVRFSAPIYKDKAPVLLVRGRDAPGFRRFKSLQAMLDGTTYVFGGKAGNVYPIDKQLENIGVRDVRINGETHALIQMLNASRFDFMMVFPEERDHLVRRANLTGESFEDISYPDIPDGQPCYLLCSTALDPKVLEAIDKAILSIVGRI